MRVTSASPSQDAANYVSIPEAKTRGFIAHNFRETRHRFIWHYHPEWELTWISEGRGQRYVGCSIESFEAGELVMLAGNLPHAWCSDEHAPDEARCSVIQFLPNLWGEEFWKLPEISKFRELCESAVRGVRFTGPGIVAVGEKMEQLANRDAPDFASFVQFVEILGMVVELPWKSLDASSEERGRVPNPRLQQLLEWIEARAVEPLTQRDVADQMNMTPSVFCRWFKMQMGCVFVRYLNELRVARACSMLVNEETSITEAAFASGFNNLSNFNRRFQEITGLTPKAFRRQLIVRVKPTKR